MNEQHELPINQTEDWKDIQGFNGDYQISSLRRIKGVERFVPRMGSRGDMTTVPERIKQKRITASGEERVTLFRLREEMCFTVDDLMEQEFGGGAMAIPLWKNERNPAKTEKVESDARGEVVKWKSIRLYRGFYEISSDRRVRSLDRVVERKDTEEGRRQAGQELKVNTNGPYPYVSLFKDSVRGDWKLDDLWEQAFGSGENAKCLRKWKPKPGRRKPYIAATKPAPAPVATTAPAPVATKRIDVDTAITMTPAASTSKPSAPDYVPGVFKRYWKLSRGWKDFIPDDGLRNIAAEFEISVDEVKAITRMQRYQTVTEPLMEELTNA